jgi:alcohol dehydrogenase (cytochrome c)
MPMTPTAPGYTEPSTAALLAALARGSGEMVAVNQDTGKIEWDDKLPSSPYGAAAVTNNIVFTTTYSGDLYAFNTATGAILLKTRLPARTNAPVTINGDYVITAGSVAKSAGQRMFIVAYRLGATGKLPGSTGS